VVTRGAKSPEQLRIEWEGIQLPELCGKTVLDVGAWDGFFSFEAERHGAKRVVALDHYVWSIDLPEAGKYILRCQQQGIPRQDLCHVPGLWCPVGLPGKRSFDLARQCRNSQVEAVVADFMDTDLDRLGAFDVVLFLGVLYHLKSPFEALCRLARVTKDLAVIETAGIALEGMPDASLLEFYETTELADDPTNWFAPTARALEGMCRAAGFRRAKVLHEPPPSQERVLRCRLVAHAWK
jgi:tRNA (mo5U34)-methyltransferase